MTVMVPAGGPAVIATRFRFVSLFFSPGTFPGMPCAPVRRVTQCLHRPGLPPPPMHRPTRHPAQPRARWPALAWLLAVGLATAAGAANAQGLPERGFRIMADGTGGNCLACHALPGQKGVPSSFGPALDTVGSRYSAQALRQWVTDARQIKPGTLMPPFGTTEGTQMPVVARSILTDEEITHVVAALQTLR